MKMGYGSHMSKFSLHFSLFLIRDTYIERCPGEKTNDRNDRAIREATLWYQNHLKNNDDAAMVVLLTNDADNRTKAKDGGLIAYTSELILIVWGFVSEKGSTCSPPNKM